jgi:site-specific DNA-methyltransferase (adenine-specific)
LEADAISKDSEERHHVSNRAKTIDLTLDTDYVVMADNIDVLPVLPGGAFQLIYIDPPFNTGKVQERKTLKTTTSVNGDRTGFGGRRFATTELSRRSYSDLHDDYLAFLGPRLEHAHRLLATDGTLYFHIDYREAHYCKVLLDEIFGRKSFLSEIIWAYDYGGRPRDRWPPKHDTILVYAREPGRHLFNRDAIERIPYMAPGLVSKEKAERGKLPTDVWWHTIVPTNGKEKTGYPTQKPEGILKRVIQASSSPGSRVLDFFAGSGTTGAVARQEGRRFVLVDNNPEAINVMANRMGGTTVRYLDVHGHDLDVADSLPETEEVPLF